MSASFADHPHTLTKTATGRWVMSLGWNQVSRDEQGLERTASNQKFFEAPTREEAVVLAARFMRANPKLFRP